MEVNNSISNLYQLRKWVTPRVEIGECTVGRVESVQSVDSVETRQSVGSTHNVATVTA